MKRMTKCQDDLMEYCFWPPDDSTGGTSEFGMSDWKCQADLASDCAHKTDLT